MKLKRFLTAAAVATMISGTMISFGSTLDGVNMINGTEEYLNILETSPKLNRVPEEIMKYFTEVGGKITFKNRLYTEDGREADGIYWTDNSIELSLRTVEDGFPNMLDYNLLHEIGHFIYFNGTLTEEDNKALDSYFSRMYGKNYDVTSKEEGFAAAYTTLKQSDEGYGLAEEEKAMLLRVEQSVVEKYLTGTTEKGPGTSVSSNYHYRGKWTLDDEKWTYTENGTRLSNTWALIFDANGSTGARTWYHFDENGYMDAEQEIPPEGVSV